MRSRPGKYDPGLKVLAIQYLREGKTTAAVQRRLRSPVTQRTIQRWYALYKETLSVVRNPAEYNRLGRNTKLTDEERDFMLTLLDLDPTLYLDEYQKAIRREFGIHLSIATVYRDLKNRLNLTRKKTRTVHPNQSATKRARFMRSIGELHPNMLVFLDESSICERSLRRDYARAPRGYRPKRVPWSRCGKRFTVLPAIFRGGVLAMACREGGFRRKHFERFLERQLLPVMQPYPYPNSVLVMDNASIHHGGKIEELAAEHGIRILYLPPYSPEFNPIEKGFGPLKANLRRTQILTRTDPDDKIDVIKDVAWKVFDARLTFKLYTACGYF